MVQAGWECDLFGLHVLLGPRQGTQRRDPEKGLRKGTQKRDPEKGPRQGTQKRDPGFGTQKWDPEMGPRNGTQKWDPEMGPRSGTQKWDTETSQLLFIHVQARNVPTTVGLFTADPMHSITPVSPCNHVI
jgi:hypothetical protein